MDFFDCAAMDASAEEFDSTSDEAGERFNALRLGGAEDHDAVFGEVTLIIECPGVAKITWRAKLGRKSKPFSIAVDAHGTKVFVLILFLDLLCIDTEAKAGAYVDGFSSRSDFLGFQIERLPHSSETRRSDTAFGGHVGSNHDLSPISEPQDL